MFNGRLFNYPSHDIDAGVKPDDLGSHFAMRDYHVLSMDRIGGKVTITASRSTSRTSLGGRQMGAGRRREGGRYYLYFPVKDKEDAFRIGVAVGSAPQGPFKAQPARSRAVQHRPVVFRDADGQYYDIRRHLGRALQRWATGSYVATDVYPRRTSRRSARR